MKRLPPYLIVTRVIKQDEYRSYIEIIDTH